MVKLIAELILAISMLFLSAPAQPEVSLAQAEPALAEVAVAEAEVYSHQDEGVMLARFENILNLNHCFGDDFASSEALVLGAQLSLAAQCEDGYIPASVVDNFVLNMYGKETEGTVLPFGDEKAGFYPVVPRGFDTYRHTVVDYSYVGDGTITVKTAVSVNPENEATLAECESVFFADGSSAFGYTLLSCNIY